MDIFYWIGVVAVVVMSLIGLAHAAFLGVQFYTRTFRNTGRLLDYHAAWRREQNRNE